MNMNKALQQYSAVNRQTGIEDKNPHELILMLYEGAIDNLIKAKGCMQRNDYAAKGELVNRALTIIGGLQGFLDMEKAGDVANNLNRLYDYSNVALFEASRDNNIEKIDEVVNIIREIKEGWEGIKDEAAGILAQRAG